MEDLVSTAWLAENLRQADVVPVDATYFLEADGRDAEAEFRSAHIPKARFMALGEVSDRSSDLPNMIPGAEAFAEAMEAIGVGSSDRIIVYDNSPLHSAARAWFMLRHFGARQVAVLDGGFPKWLAERRPTESGMPPPRTVPFEAAERGEEIVTLRQIRSGIGQPLLDARGRARFEGTGTEPHAGTAPGHIPGARNLPAADLFNPDHSFKSRDELRTAFIGAGVEPGQPFTATCGSGITACSLIFAARLLGTRDARLYDGSWSEWGADPKTPKELGPS